MDKNSAEYAEILKMAAEIPSIEINIPNCKGEYFIGNPMDFPDGDEDLPEMESYKGKLSSDTTEITQELIDLLGEQHV